ncbi:MAG TPA: DUF1735 domain-containing protein [Bacteroidales bacterium]|nr:DUF1735 domain-containing protein [Bacteroidales bacterium]
MKKLLLILISLVGMVSCENFDREFSDFKYTSGFFPYQYPVRTLVLGDYIYDNTNDNAHKFVISVAMGGVYENKMNRVFNFSVDESLCNNVKFAGTGDQIKALPTSYYTLSSPNQITIPAGKFNGGVEVQLTDAFFSDPLSFKNTYVVPLRLNSSNDVDSILSGRAIEAEADPRVETEWFVTPKNFTMFAVKYINEYHGTYFYYGSSSVKNGSGTVLENTTYSARYVEENPPVKLLTTGRYQVSLTRNLNTAIDGLKGSVNMLLTFSGNTCTITGAPGSPLTISGTGEFKSKEYEWGDKKRDGIVLNFTVTDGVNTYSASDVMVARDRAVVMELFTPKVN